MQIAFYDKQEASADFEKSYKLVKDEQGNRVVSVLYVTTDGASALTVSGIINGEEQELTGINIASLTKDDFADGQTQLYIVEPYSEVKVEASVSESANIIVKGVY